jgi:hypothetical protein
MTCTVLTATSRRLAADVASGVSAGLPVNLPASPLLLAAVALAVLLIVAYALRLLFRPRVPRSPYRRRGSLFSRDERRFYDALRQAVGGRFLIFAQMRLIDLLELPKGVRGSPFWFAKVRYKHVDFVLCDPDTAEPVLAIELDGASHQSQVQRQRDAEKDAVLEQAGLPLLRVPSQKGGYAPRALADTIGELLE